MSAQLDCNPASERKNQERNAAKVLAFIKERFDPALGLAESIYIPVYTVSSTEYQNFLPASGDSEPEPSTSYPSKEMTEIDDLRRRCVLAGYFRRLRAAREILELKLKPVILALEFCYFIDSSRLSDDTRLYLHGIIQEELKVCQEELKTRLDKLNKELIIPATKLKHYALEAMSSVYDNAASFSTGLRSKKKVSGNAVIHVS